MCKTHNPRKIDKCMRKLIQNLQSDLSDDEVEICACCCGHGRYNPSIVAKFRIANDEWIHTDLYSDIYIPRKKRFYQKDSKGFYFIPEVVK